MILTPSPDRTLVLTRVINAPIEHVFAAWSQPARLAHGWSGGAPHVLHGGEDLTGGGKYCFRVRAMDGTEHWVRGTYIHLDHPRRMNFTWLREDGAGEITCDTVVAITLERQGRKTRLTLEQTALATDAQHEEHVRGWTECLDRYTRDQAQHASVPCLDTSMCAFM